jgi:hypothetical protein
MCMMWPSLHDYPMSLHINVCFGFIELRKGQCAVYYVSERAL